MKTICIILVFTFTLMAQSFRDSVVTDSQPTMAPIPTNESLAETNTATDSSQGAISDSTGKKKIAPINKGVTIGARWSFTSSKIFTEWVNQQQNYFDDIYRIYNTTTNRDQIQWLMKPETQSSSFPISIGYFSRIDSIRSITFEALYGFRRQQGVFSVFDDTTHDVRFKNQSNISQHQAEIRFSYQFRFSPEYFTVGGVEACGLSLSAGAIPLSYFKLKTTSDEPQFNRSGSMIGFGGSWGLGMFTEKRISSGMLALVYLNYHGTATYGFNKQKELFKLTNNQTTESKPITMQENLFELGVTAVLSKKNRNEK